MGAKKTVKVGKNVEIAYKFEKAILSKIGLKSARIALQGYNVWTWTPEYYFLGDLEILSANSGFSSMPQYYPLYRSCTLALKFDF